MNFLNPTIYCLQEALLKYKYTERMEIKEWERCKQQPNES